MSLKSSGGNKYVTSKNYSSPVSRTLVENHYKWRSTFSSGYLIPLWADEVYPGGGKSVDFGELLRSITPLGPTMDNAFFDVFFFYVPMRLLWDHWEEFIAGFNKEAWAQDTVYQVPQIKFKVPDSTIEDDNSYLHSFMDYLYGACDPVELVRAQNAALGYVGMEIQYVTEKSINDVFSISALYPRAYVKIWNDWFRDENLQDELELYTGDNDEYADEFAFDLLDPTKLPKAAKYHNRFTSALPAPQKGPDVLIPMKGLSVTGDNLPVQVTASNTGTYTGFSPNAQNLDGTSVTGWVDGTTYRIIGPSASGSAPLFASVGNNLVANNVSNTIRMLRLATQTELLLARDARGGTRYVESLLSHFGVHNGDARLQRSEYLGSRQIPLSVTQVTNTTQSAGSPLGNVGGQSMTVDNAHYFSKSFPEHGIVFALGTVRTNLSYSSGIRKLYQRKDRFDFIWPEFKHIGDVPLYSRELEVKLELYSLDENMKSQADRVFGYTPYGSELREGYNANNGLFRYKADGNLAYLTYQEDFGAYDDPPVLSAEWIEQPTEVFSKTLVDQNGPQFYALFDLVDKSIIPLDPTSDPGLMDHF